MKIFMTGATGFLGRTLSLQLQRDGHELHVLTRRPKQAKNVLGGDIKIVPAYEFGLGTSPALGECDAVINLAGEPVVGRRWSRAQKARIRSSRVGTTQNLVRLMEALPNPPSIFISASAVGYYGNRVDQPVDESAEPGDDFLANVCEAWEKAAQGAERLGCRVVTLRTGIVLGQGGGALDKMLPIFRLGAGGKIGDGHQPVPWIHLVDMVRIIRAALLDDTMSGPVNAVAPAVVSNREFTEALANAVERPALIPVPAVALRAAMGKAASTVLGGQNVIPAKLQASGFSFAFPTLRLALQDLLQNDMGCTIGKAADIPSSPYLDKRRPVYELRQQTVIDAPIEEVVDFFSKAENLGVLTPPNVDFSITSPTPIDMHEGTEISYTIRLGRIPIRWRTRIDAWSPNDHFVDVQMKGPYRCWWHRHSFRAMGTSTLMEDRVLYALPFGILGRLVHRVQVSGMLLDIFTYRSRAIQVRFGSPSMKHGASPPKLRLATPSRIHATS